MNDDRHMPKAPGGYVPPATVLLDHLGITAIDLQKEKVLVNGRSLQFLISEFARHARFDQEWYAFTNPDVEGARLAGDIPSLCEHFLTSGYLEGRLPSTLPFDPEWYYNHYSDIASTFRASDVEGMRDHYLSKGYFEGRAGTEADLPEAELWPAGSVR